MRPRAGKCEADLFSFVTHRRDTSHLPGHPDSQCIVARLSPQTGFDAVTPASIRTSQCSSGATRVTTRRVTRLSPPCSARKLASDYAGCYRFMSLSADFPPYRLSLQHRSDYDIVIPAQARSSIHGTPKENFDDFHSSIPAGSDRFMQCRSRR